MLGVAGLALLGRFLETRLLASGIPSSVPMAPSTACAFLCLAAVLHPRLLRNRSLHARGGLLLLIPFLCAPSLWSFARILSQEGWKGLTGSPLIEPWAVLWTMSPLTAGLFLLLGASAAAGLSGGRSVRAWAVWGATSVAFFSGIIFIGYLYRVPLFYGGHVIPVAATTAGCFLLLSAGMVREIGSGILPWRLLEGDGPQALMLRAFIPLGCGLILFLGIIDSRFALEARPLLSALIMIFTTLGLAALVLRLSARVSLEIEKADIRLRESESRFRSLIEGAPDAVYVQSDGRFVYLNPAALRLFGASRPEELLGQPFSLRIAPEYLDAIRERIRVQKETGRPVPPMEQEYLRLDGRRVPVETSAVAIRYQEQDAHVVFVRDISERRRAEEDLRRTQMRFRELFDRMSSGAAVYEAVGDGEDFIFRDFNCAAERIEDLPKKEVIGRRVSEVFPGVKEFGLFEVFQRVWRTGIPEFYPQSLYRDDRGPGGWRENWVFRLPGGELVAVYNDVTARKREEREKELLQAQLLQSQKMESVGRLAGGVAHDFNNLLTAILGNTRFLLEEIPPDDPRRSDVQGIQEAAERAAGLTRQLLAFSRRQILSPRTVDLRAVLTGTAKLLGRLLGERVRVVLDLHSEVCPVKVDVGQIEQVVVNLAVNARDAMPEGGTLTLECRLLPEDEAFFASHPDFPRGPLVRLRVKDDGCGMSEETQKHLFEPFFTTKPVGQGTGLGLSTALGIVEQSGGEIEVESAPGKGTTFSIHLPQARSAVEEPSSAPAEEDGALLRGSETVLLAEDESIVRRLAERTLRAGGYNVLSAADGKEALEALEKRGKPVDILVTDVVMPGMNGPELAEEVSRRGLARRVLFLSGYTDEGIVEDGILEEGVALLYKPFSPAKLLGRLREVLDGPPEGTRA